MRAYRGWEGAAGGAAIAIVMLISSVALLGQAASAPNPYKWDEAWKPQLPEGRE